MLADVGWGRVVHHDGGGCTMMYLRRIGMLLHVLCCGNAEECTESSKPSAGGNAKKIVKCTDSGKLYVSDGVDWKEVHWHRICPPQG